MSNEIATSERKGPPQALVNEKGIQIENLDTMWWWACRVIESNMAPKDCKGPSDIIVRAQHGMSAGLNFMQSIQYVSNVNGRPCIWGPPLKALILYSGKCKTWREEIIGDDPFKDDFTIKITIERTDMDGEQVVKFSTRDAKRAGLMSRETYKQYPEDMLLYRCSGRVAKRHFPDVISGLIPAEGAHDIIEVQAEVTDAEPAARPKTLDEVTTKIKAKRAKAAPEPEPVPDENGEILDDGEGAENPEADVPDPEFGGESETLFGD